MLGRGLLIWARRKVAQLGWCTGKCLLYGQVARVPQESRPLLAAKGVVALEGGSPSAWGGEGVMNTCGGR